MDLLLLFGGLAVLVVLIIVWMQRNKDQNNKKKNESSSSSSSSSSSGKNNGLTVNPILRNRHAIQNGTTKFWTLKEVSQHNQPDDLLIVIHNKVYDVSDFVEDHPGGPKTIIRYAGADNTEPFSGIQHPAKVWDIIRDYYVGEVVKEEHKIYSTVKNLQDTKQLNQNL